MNLWGIGKSATRGMKPEQCRAGRILAGLSQAELAEIAVLPATLITDYETGVGMPEPCDLAEIRSVLEWAGIEFVDNERDGPPGVRLRK
jgi:transcriptional regulator with XRE-family HTH domain